MSGEIQIRACTQLGEFRACVALQKEIWGEADLEIVPDTIFVVAANTGGQILGAFDGKGMIGFTLAVPGVRNGAAYLHSHMTGVRANYRDRGVGRMLKLFQREEALSRDIRLIEWTFDPLEMRNAHFNLNRLGAIARRYLPDLYGITSSPLHRGLATDRLVAEWYLDSPRVCATLQNELPAPQSASRIEIPASLEDWKVADLQRVQQIQSAIRDRFSEEFAKGHAAVCVAKNRHASSYVLVPWSDF
jgi:predicted GNAT superfamily acetyltransferase